MRTSSRSRGTQPGAARTRTLAALSVLASLALTAPAQARPTGSPLASAAGATAATARAAGHTLAVRERALRACLRSHPGRCAASRRQLGEARSRLRAAALSQEPALTIAVSGYTLRWRAIGENWYVFVRKVAGQPDRYSVLHGNSVTPPAVPGATVRYSVRGYSSNRWAPEVAISYPSSIAPTPPPTGRTAGIEAPSGSVPAEGGASGEHGGGAKEGTGGSKEEGKSKEETGSGKEGTKEEAPRKEEPPKEEPPKEEPPKKEEPPREEPPKEEKKEEPPKETGEPFVRGVDSNLTGWGAGAVSQIAAEMRSVNAAWEREDLVWAEAEPAPGVFNWTSFEAIVAAAKSNGVTLLPIVGYAPSWTGPGNATAYAEFVAAAVKRFGPGTSANLQWWELWNEPYFAYAWSGKTPEPEAYAKDALAAAKAAKAVAPSVKLLVAADYQDSAQTGGSTQWETSWIDDMFTAAPALGQWVDGVSVHPYGDDPATPLVAKGSWKDASGQWAFQRIDTIHEKFLAHGANLPMWITEEGWSTWNVSEATQSKDYADLIAQVKARPWVKALFSYCLREFTAKPTNDQSGYGLLKYGTWQPKPAFQTLAEGFKALD